MFFRHQAMGNSNCMQSNNSILIATLGSKPQIITLSLDCLRQSGEMPDCVAVVHADQQRLETQQALQALQADFAIHSPQTPLRSLELSYQSTPLQDITQPDEVESAFQALYAEVRSAKLADRRVHLQIAGGRRTLSVFGMAAAQMLFDDQDRLWHLASHPELEASGRLHAAVGEWARLIPIPVIAWGRLSPAFDALRRVDDPLAAAQALSRLRLREQWDAARIFVLTRLSPAELSAVELLSREGLGQNEIAARLSLSPRTVEQHLRSAYRKAAEHWDLEDVNQAQLVRLLSLYFSYGMPQKN